MQKLLFLFMVCVAIGLTLARQDKGRPNFKKRDSSHWNHEPIKFDKKLSKFCSNNTLAQAYLTQLLSVLDALQANASYNSILQFQSANYIKYLKDTTNQGLLNSDCEGFMKGLKAAMKADKEVERTQKNLAKIIEKKIKQVAWDITHGKGFYEFDN